MGFHSSDDAAVTQLRPDFSDSSKFGFLYADRG